MSNSIPLTRKAAVQACLKMQKFYSELTNLYDRNSMNISSNRGRRNMLMSAPMEKYLADAIRDSGNFKKVSSDGRTGEADITIEDNGNLFEIECKLTSPHQSSGSICFQTDHDTLVNKESLDYVYIIANEDFDGFVVIYFSGLTIDEFRGLSPGARGKVQMFKWKGMKKATVLVGESISSVDIALEKLQTKHNLTISEKLKQVNNWKQKLMNLDASKKYQAKILTEKINRSLEYIDECLNKNSELVKITSEKKARYGFKYENLMEKK